jgi:foldase protein PrsA
MWHRAASLRGLERALLFVFPIVIAFGLASSPIQGQETGSRTSPETVLATYDGGEVTVAEFLERMRLAQEKYGDSYNAAMLRDDILEGLATGKILEIEAKRLGYVDELGERDSEVIASKEKVMVNTLRRDVILRGVEVTEREIKELYDLGATRRLTRSIVVSNKEDAERVGRELAAGADLLELVDEWSLDLGAARWQGLLAWVQPGDGPEDLEEFIYGLRMGEIGGPVESAQGYYFFRVDSIYHASQKPYEDRRARLRSTLRRRRYTPVYNAYMDSVALAKGVKYDDRTIGTIVERFASEGWVEEYDPGRRSVIPTYSPDELAMPVFSFKGGSRELNEYIKFVKGERVNPAFLLAGREEVERGLRAFVRKELALYLAYEMEMDKVLAVRGHVRQKATEKGVLAMLVDAAGGEESARASEEDRRTFYEQNPNLYTEPDAVLVSMVTILEEESVDDLYADAKSGAPFSELASDYRWILDEDRTSERLELASREIYPTVFDVVRRMEVGAVSEPIPMPEGGFTVVKLLEKKPGKVLPYEEVWKEVTADVNMKILGNASTLIREFQESLREKYNYRVDKEAFEAVTL